MTILALDTNVASDLKHGRVFSEGKANRPLPRVNIRKRPCSSSKKPAAGTLFNVSSALLTGLFADAAEAAPVSIEDSPKASPKKKARLDRNGRSFVNLGDVCDIPTSPIGASTSFFTKQDSLQFQLGCVGGADVHSAIPFPHLPATVSSASVGTSDLAHAPEDSDCAKETYGWFVELDDDHDLHHPAARPIATTDTHDLAFSAHTAPKAENHDAEVEWAKAADTVDDVLGDFF